MTHLHKNCTFEKYSMIMKPATISQIKADLQNVPPKDLIAIILRLSKYKVENKELVSYLLFDAEDESFYVEQIKISMDELFKEINTDHLYYAKKGIRKTLRRIDKYIRYSSKPITETELRIYFCEKLQASKIPIYLSQVLLNLYNSQLKKIDKAMSKMHEDEQFDFINRIEQIK